MCSKDYIHKFKKNLFHIKNFDIMQKNENLDLYST